MRTLKDALETRLGTKVLTVPRDGEPSPLVSWIIEYAAVLLNRYEVGHDGKTAHERLREKKVERVRRGVWGSSTTEEQYSWG